MDVIVHHKRKWSDTPASIRKMYHAVYVGEVVEQVQGASKIHHEVCDDMRKEHNISWVPYNTRSYSSIWLDQAFVDPYRNVFAVPACEHSRSKFWAVGIIKCLELRDRVFVMIQNSYLVVCGFFYALRSDCLVQSWCAAHLALDILEEILEHNDVWLREETIDSRLHDQADTRHRKVNVWNW